MCFVVPLAASSILAGNWEPHLGYPWDEIGSSQNRIYSAFQMTHDVTAHLSKLVFNNLKSKVWNNWKKSRRLFWHFWSPPRQSAHKFCASEHSHSKCPTDLGCWQQISHRGSTYILRLFKFSLVGRTFAQARQRNILTFGGTFSFHNFLHIGLSMFVVECSIRVCSFILTTMR